MPLQRNEIRGFLVRVVDGRVHISPGETNFVNGEQIRREHAQVEDFQGEAKTWYHVYITADQPVITKDLLNRTDARRIGAILTKRDGKPRGMDSVAVETSFLPGLSSS